MREARQAQIDATPFPCGGKQLGIEERAQLMADCSTARIAVHAHIFYDDLASEIASYLKNIPVSFDLFVTTDTGDKAAKIAKAFEAFPHIGSLEISVCENRGRDVLPFISQMLGHIEDYDLICHIHTKRSLHFDKGEEWRRYLFESTLGSEDLVLEIIAELSGSNPVGMIYAEPFEPIAPFVEWGSNRSIAEETLNAIDLNIEIPDDIIFPAGNMFWARADAVKDLFDERVLALWDESTDSAENGTVMHAIERLWTYVARYNGYKTLLIIQPAE